MKQGAEEPRQQSQAGCLGWLLPGQAGWEPRASMDGPRGATAAGAQQELWLGPAAKRSILDLCCKMCCFEPLLQNAVTTEGQILCHKSLQGFHVCREGEGRASHYSLPARDAEQKQTRWSQHLLGWKRALKSLKSNQHLTVPGPPLSHVPSCHIHAPLKHPLGWGCHQHPGQPVPVPFCKEILLTPTLNLPWHNLRPLPRILSPVS